MSLSQIEKEVNNLVDTNKETPSKSVDSAPLTMKDRALGCLKPPFVYFIGLFFVILFALYYTKPCYVLSNEIDPKTRKKKLNYKMLLAYTIGISGLIGFGVHPYVMKK